MKYYLIFTCAECDEDFYHGVYATLIEHNGLPAIPFDIAAQTSATCTECGAQNFTGDFELETE